MFHGARRREHQADVEFGIRSARVFPKAGVFPGLLIRGREELSDKVIKLEVEILPDVPPEKLELRLVDGEWKLASGFSALGRQSDNQGFS
jgi:hypothetical protein